MDARRVELRHRFLSGDPQSGVKLLEAMSRAGELRRGAVELSSYLGDPAAQLLVPCSAPEPFLTWVEGLAAFGLEAGLRAGLAALRVLLPLWSDAQQGHGSDPRLATEIARLEQYVDRPTPQAAEEVGITPSDPLDLSLSGGTAVDVWEALGRFLRSHEWPLLGEAMDRASFEAGEAKVRAQVRAELCAWALPDPAWELP